MIFSELYSAYYNAVAKILTELLNGEKDEKKLAKTVSEYAFGESFMTVIPSLKSGKWQLVKDGMIPVVGNIPTMPLTVLQKRWLRSVMDDGRIKLFGVEFDGLSEVEPLFTKDDYYIYDKYLDGDNFTDEGYIERFRTVLKAINEKLPLEVHMTSRVGNRLCKTVIPERLEYSEKDDKFRLVTKGTRFVYTINLARITECRIPEKIYGTDFENLEKQYGTFTLKINNQRNALERCMLHFAHFEKRAEKISEDEYMLTVKYDRDDTTELVIRVLSFGPMVEVTGPKDFRNLIIERLKKQKNCGL